MRITNSILLPPQKKKQGVCHNHPKPVSCTPTMPQFLDVASVWSHPCRILKEKVLNDYGKNLCEIHKRCQSPDRFLESYTRTTQNQFYLTRCTPGSLLIEANSHGQPEIRFLRSEVLAQSFHTLAGLPSPEGPARNSTQSLVKSRKLAIRIVKKANPS